MNSINSTTRNRLLLQLFISEMIHAKQWHYSLQQRLPEASFHVFYTKNPRNSSSTNSTCRRQRDLLSKAFQPQDLPQAFQFYRDIPVIHDIPDIPVIPDIPTLLALLHVPAPSSTNQYLPVLSSVSSISRDSTRSSISLIRMHILHIDWFPPETPLSANQYKTFYKHYILQRKGDVAISVIRHYSTE